MEPPGGGVNLRGPAVIQSFEDIRDTSVCRIRFPAWRPRLKTSCPVCSGSPPFGVVCPSLRGSRFAVLRCPGCDTAFVDPQPGWEEIKQLYTADFYKSWDLAAGESSNIAAMKKMTFARRIQDLQKYVATGKILDVGTASGFLLDVAQQRGFEPFGVEISEYSGGIAAAKFGPDHIHIGTLETAPFRAGTFDLITMTDLLEHVPDPLGVLRVAHRLLKPRGYVLITTPNTHSFSCKLMGSRWTHYNLYHLIYSNPDSMQVIASNSGFRIAMCRSAEKVVNIGYLRSQFFAFRHWALTPLIRSIHALCRPFANLPIRLTTGDMMVILEKQGEPAGTFEPVNACSELRRVS